MYGDPDGHFPGVMEEITGAAAKIIFCNGLFLRPIGAKNHTGPFFGWLVWFLAFLQCILSGCIVG